MREGQFRVEGMEVPGAVIGADGVLQGTSTVEQRRVLYVELAGDFGDFAYVHHATIT